MTPIVLAALLSLTAFDLPPMILTGCDCRNGACTLSVPVEVEVRLPIAEKVHATARRSVGVAVKVAVAPVRVVKAVAEKKPVRNAIAAKPARKALAVVGRCICHRRHSE